MNNLDEIILQRRSVRSYKRDKVDRKILSSLIQAGSLAPISCNLQLTQYVIIDDDKLADELNRKVSYKFRQAPATILVLQDSRFSKKRLSGVMSAGMSVQNILLKATELGLGTCAMAGFSKDGTIKRILNIPDHMDILLAISVGYEDKSVYKSEISRLPTHSQMSYNRYEDLAFLKDSVNLSDHSLSSIIDYRGRISQVYQDRFRLNTYTENYYKEAFDYFKKNLLSLPKNSKILDLISYDGVFLKIMNENGLKEKVCGSDYLDTSLNFFRHTFGIDMYKVDASNNIEVGAEKFDIMTFIYQASFTPELEKLITSAEQKLKPGGRLLIADVGEPLLKRLARLAKSTYLKLFKKEIINIYENNTYYKIGPKKYLNDNYLVKICKKAGFKIQRQQKINKSRGVFLVFYEFVK